jgi:tetratricopeptide (TPR) repeat protein
MNFYWLVGAFIAGSIFILILRSFGVVLWRAFMSKTRLIKYYWIFVIIFSVLSTISYYLILSILKDQQRTLAISVANQATGLIFAIFVGYFAFAQVMETRKEKYDRVGATNMLQQNYRKAIENWELAHSIKPKDSSTLQNLLEAYLLNKQFDDFDRKIGLLEKVAVDDEKIVLYYLKVCRELFKSHLAEAEAEISKTVDYIKENSSYFKRLGWGFKELRESETYKGMRGDVKKLIDNYTAYVDRTLTPEQIKQFENGNYLLEKHSAT